MTSKKYWRHLSKKFLSLHQNMQFNSSVKLEGYCFDVFPGVFSPELSSDTEWFIKQLIPLIKNKTFLEIGTGCGVIGCLAKLNGARNVVVTDINSLAVKNAIHNINKHCLDISALSGNIYEPLPVSSKFDIIFWNHPFNYTEDESDQNSELSYSVFDLSYSALKNYFRNSRSFLDKGGILLLGTGNIARISLIKKIASENSYKMNLIAKEIVSVSRTDAAKMDVRLYSFPEKQGN